MEVVVSRYSDDLSWLPALAGLLNANITVYCKARACGGEATALVWPCSKADSPALCAPPGVAGAAAGGGLHGDAGECGE